MMAFITGLILGAVGAFVLLVWKARTDASAAKTTAKPQGGGGPGAE